MQSISNTDETLSPGTNLGLDGCWARRWHGKRQGSSVQLTPVPPFNHRWDEPKGWDWAESSSIGAHRGSETPSRAAQAARSRIHSIQKRPRPSRLRAAVTALSSPTTRGRVRRWACFTHPKFKYSFKNGLEMKSVFHRELTTQKREIIHSDFSLK